MSLQTLIGLKWDQWQTGTASVATLKQNIESIALYGESYEWLCSRAGLITVAVLLTVEKDSCMVYLWGHKDIVRK